MGEPRAKKNPEPRDQRALDRSREEEANRHEYAGRSASPTSGSRIAWICCGAFRVSRPSAGDALRPLACCLYGPRLTFGYLRAVARELASQLSGFHACRREFCFQIKTYMAVACTSSNKWFKSFDDFRRESQLRIWSIFSEQFPALIVARQENRLKWLSKSCRPLSKKHWPPSKKSKSNKSLSLVTLAQSMNGTGHAHSSGGSSHRPLG